MLLLEFTHFTMIMSEVQRFQVPPKSCWFYLMFHLVPPTSSLLPFPMPFCKNITCCTPLTICWGELPAHKPILRAFANFQSQIVLCFRSDSLKQQMYSYHQSVCKLFVRDFVSLLKQQMKPLKIRTCWRESVSCYIL